jgi:Domain of unknown function (DUF4398)
MIAQHCRRITKPMLGGEQSVNILARAQGVAARLGVMALLAALAGCAQAPVPHEALSTADLALARARTAGAADYASIELARAEAKLEAARAAIQAKAYEQARTLAEQALVDAELAEVMAQIAEEKASARRLREHVELQHGQLAPADDGI